ncbi:MAG: c-type cytochrome [Pseudoxanthomonas suwonensis]|nr:c-type cytochrome [Pseudoxanthomonas suwonensis]
MRPLLIALGLTLALPLLSLAQDAEPETRTDQAPPQLQGELPEPPAATTDSAITSAALTGNSDRGRTLTYTCVGCHGIADYRNIYPHYRVPKIGGQAETYLSNALNAYRNGQREHPTMQVQAENYSEQDIADIAAFLSGLNK